MSAFIVSEKHIHVIVTALKRQECWSTKEILKKYNQDLNLIGKILWSENFRSVNYRYDENSKTPNYEFAQIYVSYYQVIKAIDCLKYQSCEHEDWEFSEAKNILDKLENVIFHKIKDSNKDYQNASWSID